VAARKVLDLGSIAETPDLRAVLVANAHTIVLVGGDDDSQVMMVQSPVELPFEGESCPGPELKTFEGQDESCHPIEDMCPVGDLKGDMEVVAGLAITGALFLALGTIVTCVYALIPWTLKIGHFISFGLLLVAWVMLLAAFAHMDSLSNNAYGCYFVDESMRGGLVLLHGTLECLTRASYSWAFCIYSFGMLTIALCAVAHRVFVEVSDPWVPPQAEEEEMEAVAEEKAAEL